MNGNRHAWASVEVKIASQIVYATAVNYERKRNRGWLRGNHPDPLGKTIGENEYTADVEVGLAEFNLIQQLLISQANQQGLNGGYGDVRFQVIVQYSENGFDTITDTINGCTMDSTNGGGTQSPDPLKRKFDLNPVKILFNGQDDLAIPLAAPPAG